MAAELDTLARSFDVLFVVSAGNIRRRDLGSSVYPEYFKEEVCRITPPAESLLSLTVGSIAARENGGILTKAGHPSPFTRRGPGFCNFRKPDLVEHGGNLGQQWNSTEDLSPAGLDSTGKQLAYAVGTSHAAPIISRLASQIFSSFPSASSGLVRALLLHAATFPEGIAQDLFQDEAKLSNLLGCGVPILDSILYSSPHCQNFVFQGKMDYREILRIPFYVPKHLCSRKGDKVRIAYTVAYLPETEKTLRTGYCKSQIRANVFKRSVNESLKKVPKGDLENVVKTPYSTVLHDDRIYSQQVAGGEWELSLEHISRWKLKDSKIPIAAVVSVLDPQQEDGINIYNLIRQEIPNKFRAELQVRESVAVKVR